MRVSDVMTPHVEFAHPEQTLNQAAALMAELDIGALPVGENNRLVGMITDRDIAIRAVALGKPVTTKVREIMTPAVKYCYEDEKVDHVAHNMGDIQVRRLPVVDRERKLVGIVTVGDLAGKRPEVAGEATKAICERRGAAEAA